MPRLLTGLVGIACVVAVDPGGTRYHVLWSDGFRGGTASEAVVRDASGRIVVRDGDVLRAGDMLQGHTVCASGDSLYVLP